MAVKTILLTAFVALVAAVPQHAEHMGKAQIARSDQAFAGSDLAGRTISYDGSCGSWSGMTCANNGCCSAQGWCGSSAIHCGTGCQVGFGQCGSGTDAQTPAVESPAPAPKVVVPAPVAPEPVPEVKTTSTTSSTTTSTTSSSSTFIAAVASAVLPAEGGQKNADHQPGLGRPAPSTSLALPVTTAQPTPVSTPDTSSPGKSLGLGDSYKLYNGDGSLAAGWPAESSWVDFDTAFENNRPLLKQSCAQFGAANNNDDEISNLKSALLSVGASSGVDSRFLLAIVMQESGGCVRAPTTNYGVRNPGLFQSHDGAGTCNDSGNVQNPCPQSQIIQMVTDGAAGTAAGDGLKQTIAQARTNDVSKYYRAARIYNSGSIASTGQLQDGIATHCYSSDVANRLTGWVHAAHGCSG